MKSRLLIMIVIIVIMITVFVTWSFTDMPCKPCMIPPDAPENYGCVDSCTPEPKWASWFR